MEAWARLLGARIMPGPGASTGHGASPATRNHTEPRASKLVLNLPTPEGWIMEGWVDLGYPAMHRPGVELAIFRSQVRQVYRATDCSCCFSLILASICWCLLIQLNKHIHFISKIKQAVNFFCHRREGGGWGFYTIRHRLDRTDELAIAILYQYAPGHRDDSSIVLSRHVKTCSFCAVFLLF